MITYLISSSPLPHFDIVHSNTTYIIEGAALACARKVPHIWNLREVPGASPSWQPALGWEGMLRFVDNMSDSIVSVSQAIEKALPENMKAKTIRDPQRTGSININAPT